MSVACSYFHHWSFYRCVLYTYSHASSLISNTCSRHWVNVVKTRRGACNSLSPSGFLCFSSSRSKVQRKSLLRMWPLGRNITWLLIAENHCHPLWKSNDGKFAIIQLDKRKRLTFRRNRRRTWWEWRKVEQAVFCCIKMATSYTRSHHWSKTQMRPNGRA